MNSIKAQKLLIYVMPTTSRSHHKFMTLRRTKKRNGRYVTGAEFKKFGLYWPHGTAKTRRDLALRIGLAILDEAGV